MRVVIWTRREVDKSVALPLGCQVLRSSQGSRLRQSALRKRPESSGKISVVFAEGRKKGPLSP